ncbi:alpha/beta-hydrolase [Xylariaceae sp. FL0255]|nr:alpha/beta-hydrolase [Xylariaceae sp. FL0255]
MSNIVNTICDPVVVESGSISGINRPNGTRAFLGVPFAAPPVGDLRWCPPERPHPWTGIRRCHKFGPSCPQVPAPSNSLFFGGETNFSEDCLYLNIYTGPDAENGNTKATTTGRSVLVWLHYGAFVMGSGSSPMHEGGILAGDGITVVTVNYRLGRLGFLAHPQLTKESGSKAASGNYALMDQIAALEWVQRNIKAFGGDPNNVTVGGVSAGGASTHMLRSSPLAKGLFHKIICESGPGVARAIDGPGHISVCSTLAAAEKAGEELMGILGVESITEMRKLPAEKILPAPLSHMKGPWRSNLRPGSTSLSIYDTRNPIVDGYVLPESPCEALISRRAIDVPMITGHVAQDGTALPQLFTVVEYESFLKETFGEDGAAEALRLFPAKTDAEVPDATRRLLAEQIFVWPTWTAARLQARYLDAPVWYYRFNRAPPIPSTADIAEKDYARAFHLAGVMYAFGNLDSWDWDWTDADRELSKQIRESWVQFMLTGRPSNSWPGLELEKGLELIRIWDCNAKEKNETLGTLAADVTEFWDRYYGLEGMV